MLEFAVVLAMVLAAVGCGGSKSETGSAPAATQAAQPQSQAATGEGGCQKVAQPAPRKDGGESKPKGKLDPKKTYTVTVQTNCGTFAFKLDVKDSPDTTAAFAGLVRRGFFNGLTFHRIVPDFVIQGGDPVGDGSGGPGFHTVDPPPADADYSFGVVAMVRGGNEPAGAAASQFFVVTAQDAQLPPDYAILGKLSEGSDVVRAIGKQGTPTQEGTPTQTVVMQKVTVSP
jgi:cyclophilin family peptidyl-prolyl cis-trans isomerase